MHHRIDLLIAYDMHTAITLPGIALFDTRVVLVIDSLNFQVSWFVNRFIMFIHDGCVNAKSVRTIML